MTYTELNDMIAAFGYPYSYNHFDAQNPPELPFVIFDYPEEKGTFADNTNYCEIIEVDLFYCSNTKDIDAELSIEEALTENEIPFVKYSEWIPDEAMQQTTYELEVILNG